MPIYVVPYDPSWADKFESEKASLEQLLAPWRKGSIEHVGSTAVPGLCAKPVIDIMAGVASLSESEPAKDILRQAGYQYAEYKTDIMHWFCKPSAAFRTHHLHLVPLGSERWRECLRFRDTIRCDEKLAAEYASLKRDLAARFKFDREAYTEGKTPFVARVSSIVQRGSAFIA